MLGEITAHLIDIAKVSPWLAFLVVMLAALVVITVGCVAILFVMSYFSTKSVRDEKQTVLEHSVSRLLGDVATLSEHVVELSRQAQEPSTQPAQPAQQQISDRRFFYVAFDVVIDHDRNIEEFGVPGLEVIRRGTVHRPGSMVFVALDGLFVPSVTRQLIMQRHAQIMAAPDGVNVDLSSIIEQFSGQEALVYGTIGTDGENTQGEILDVVITCVRELSAAEFTAHHNYEKMILLQRPQQPPQPPTQPI